MIWNIYPAKFLDAYQFGYLVQDNQQFHHEIKGPDGVTYGCYGYIDPNKVLQVTHYVADGMGYRIVQPNQQFEVYPVINNNQQNE